MSKFSKKIAVVVALLGVTSSSAFAFPKPEDMRANYAACAAQDKNWEASWGQYVVAFDVSSATRVCEKNAISNDVTAHLTGCKVNGKTLWVGYYCDEVYGN